MARKSVYRGEPEEEPELDISSLIDVSFLLLIYFLVTSTLQPKEVDLGIQLPADNPSSNPVKLEPLTIKIDKEGAIFVGEQAVEAAGSAPEVPALVSNVTRYAEICRSTETEPVVVVAADDEAKQQRFIDVVNALASAQIKSVTLTGFRPDA